MTGGAFQPIPFATVIDSSYISVTHIWMLVVSLTEVPKKRFYSEAR